MADTAIAITAGLGTNVDTRTEGTNGNHRQVIVIGDPATNAGVAPVDATTGLAVNVTNASLTVASHAVTNAGTFAVQSSVAAGAATIAKAEDVASADADVGVPAMAVRKATPANTSGTDGDYEFLQMSAGRVWADANIRFAGTTPDLGTGTSGTATQRIIIDSSQLGSAISATFAYAAGGIQAVAIPSDQVWGVGATGFTKLEDAASADGDKGVPAMVVRKATPANTSGTDGDYEFLQTSGGKLWTMTSGSVATNVAIADNPLNLGAQAVSSENAAVTTARQVQLVADLVGKLIVLPYANPENFVSGAITSAMTGTTSTSLIAAPASGLRNYITQITVSNAHATVGTDIVIQDGSGGTTLYTIPAAAVYGGAVVTFPTPLRQPTTATAIFCANVTTGASTKVSASGYKGA